MPLVFLPPRSASGVQLWLKAKRAVACYLWPNICFHDPLQVLNITYVFC